MSTLPEIFKSSSKNGFEKPKPKRQGGIFALKLKETPITQQLQPKKYSQSRVGTSYTTRTGRQTVNSEYRPYSRQSLSDPRIEDWSARGAWMIEEKKIENAEEIENIKRRLDENKEKMEIIEEDYDSLQQESASLKTHLLLMKQKIELELQQIEQVGGYSLGRLRKQLSEWRRQSGMGMKVNKADGTEVGQGLKQLMKIAEDFTDKINCLQEECIQ